MDAAYVIPKKELASWRKWEFGALDTLRTHQKTEPRAPAQAPQPAAPPDQPGEQIAVKQDVPGETIPLPTAEQIEQIYQQAREEGERAGYQAGKERAAQESTVEIRRLQRLTDTFAQELKQIDQTVAQDLLTLSIDLARKIADRTLQIKPELILPIVEEALRQLPVVTQPIRLMLHPDDAVRIRAHLESQPLHPECHIHEDTRIEPGGCRVEASGCEVDATLSTRWERILAPFGQDRDWLA